MTDTLVNIGIALVLAYYLSVFVLERFIFPFFDKLDSE